MSPGPALSASARVEAHVSGPGRSSHTYPIPANGGNVYIATHLTRGVNELAISATSVAKVGKAVPVAPTVFERGVPLMIVSNVHLGG
jgi:hypothetical protein